MVVGEGQDFIVAIICIDMSIVGRWAESKLITYTTYQDLSAKDEVYNLIYDEVTKINATLPEKTRIKRFALLFKELDADDGELTRTRKIRRKFVYERYQALLDSLYTSLDETMLKTEIVYQDGRKREISGQIKLKSV
jgi:long-chain acyl-CoA synthetase